MNTTFQNKSKGKTVSIHKNHEDVIETEKLVLLWLFISMKLLLE